MAELLTPESLLVAAAALIPVPRSLTGAGVRQSLSLLAAHVPLRQVEVPSGTPAFDWEVPLEWTLRTARLEGPDGAVVADVIDHPLHVVGYSTSVDATLDLAALQDHLYSDPDLPDAIPYRTSYYTPRWGFCLTDRVRRTLPDGDYRAVIDADLAPGHMTYGELVIPADTPGADVGTEVLVTSHICHPGMANDNVSGNIVAAALAQAVARMPHRRHTWRFLWMPGTIGELTWLATHRETVDQIVAGIVLAGLGDAGALTWKRSRRGDALVDRVAAMALRESGVDHCLVDYAPWGYAERQFCSPGFDLGVGRLSRTEHGTYPQYHTSADDLDFISGHALHEAVQVLTSMAEGIERNATYRNLKPFGEPRLGPRGLYPSMGGPAAEQAQLALLWVLSESDGRGDLVAIAERSGLPFGAILTAANAASQTDLLGRHDEGRG